MEIKEYKEMTTAKKKKFWREHPLIGDIEIKLDGISSFKMKCDNDDSVVKELHWTNFIGWEKTSLALWKNLLQHTGKQSVVLDIGAYSGIYSIIASKFEDRRQIYACDIQENCIDRLHQNFKLNAIDKASIIKSACTDTDGQIEFYYYEEEGIMSSVAGIVKKKMNNLKASVPSIKLDDWIRKDKNQNVKLVKIDVEGAEQKTLEGMMGILKTQKPDILIEINEAKHIRAIKNNIPKDYSIYDIIENELTIKKLGYFTKNSSDRNYLLTVKSKKDLTGIFQGKVK